MVVLGWDLRGTEKTRSALLSSKLSFSTFKFFQSQALSSSLLKIN